MEAEVFPFTLPKDLPLGTYSVKFDVLVRDPQSSRTQLLTSTTNTFEVVDAPASR